jgi:hypothetical protein
VKTVLGNLWKEEGDTGVDDAVWVPGESALARRILMRKLESYLGAIMWKVISEKGHLSNTYKC